MCGVYWVGFICLTLNSNPNCIYDCIPGWQLSAVLHTFTWSFIAIPETWEEKTDKSKIYKANMWVVILLTLWLSSLVLVFVNLLLSSIAFNDPILKEIFQWQLGNNYLVICCNLLHLIAFSKMRWSKEAIIERTDTNNKLIAIFTFYTLVTCCY